MSFDLESSLSEQANDNLKLWARLRACESYIHNSVREKMQANFDITLPRFDMMAHLYGHKKGLRMGELSARLMVSNGNITTICNQLEKDALIERIANSRDKRSVLICLTAEGNKLYRKMQKQYEIYVAEAFASLSDAQTKKLYKALGELKDTFVEK